MKSTSDSEASLSSNSPPLRTSRSLFLSTFWMYSSNVSPRAAYLDQCRGAAEAESSERTSAERSASSREATRRLSATPKRSKKIRTPCIMRARNTLYSQDRKWGNQNLKHELL